MSSTALAIFVGYSSVTTIALLAALIQLRARSAKFTVQHRAAIDYALTIRNSITAREFLQAFCDGNVGALEIVYPEWPAFRREFARKERQEL